MIASLALAAALADFPPPVVGPIPVETECARPEKIKPALPKAHKPGLVVKHRPKHRLFKADPKPKDEEEPCAELPAAPPLTLFVEPEPQYSVPVEPTFAEAEPEPEFPSLTVLPLEPEPTESPSDRGPPGGFYAVGGPCCYRVPFVPAVPEPSTWALLLAGVVIVARRVRA